MKPIAKIKYTKLFASLAINIIAIILLYTTQAKIESANTAEGIIIQNPGSEIFCKVDTTNKIIYLLCKQVAVESTSALGNSDVNKLILANEYPLSIKYKLDPATLPEIQS